MPGSPGHTGAVDEVEAPVPGDTSPCSAPQLSVANKAPGTEGQQQAHGEKEAPAVPSAPPSYEEATSGEGLKAGAFPPAPTAVPLHPSWAYVDPSKSPSSRRPGHQGEWRTRMEKLNRRKGPRKRKALCGCRLRLCHPWFRMYRSVLRLHPEHGREAVADKSLSHGARGTDGQWLVHRKQCGGAKTGVRTGQIKQADHSLAVRRPSRDGFP